MFPKINLDLIELDYLRERTPLLERELATLRKRITADSLRGVGQSATCDELQQEVVRLRANQSDGWKQSDYWQGRYRKANTERWLWRVGGGIRLGLDIRSLARGLF